MQIYSIHRQVFSNDCANPAPYRSQPNADLGHKYDHPSDDLCSARKAATATRSVMGSGVTSPRHSRSYKVTETGDMGCLPFEAVDEDPKSEEPVDLPSSCAPPPIRVLFLNPVGV